MLACACSPAEYLNYNQTNERAAAKAAVNITEVTDDPYMDVGRAETTRVGVARSELPDNLKPENPFSQGVSMYDDYLIDPSR